MTDELFSVRDQVVLISGGSRGIGRGLAEGFASRGARVIVTGRDETTLKQAADEMAAAAGAPLTPMVCDVANPAAIARLAERALSEFGQIDTLINVAGVNKRKRAETYTEEEYDFIVDINLKGAFLLSQAIGRAMLERRQGCQINIVSLNNDRPLKAVLPYAVSKAGMGHMTRALATEWGPRGVRVNAIAPGFILTDLTRQLWSDPTMQAWGRANTPLERLGTPADLVGAAIFLASPASAFMTGQILYVDGGMSAGLMWPINV
jgi:NAD(P)-dependent dehydrogenase (short-subunit alcohol dehydrogenase family)